jgi:hypothetical protein
MLYVDLGAGARNSSVDWTRSRGMYLTEWTREQAMIDLNPETVTNIATYAREFQTAASMEAETAPSTMTDDRAFERLTEWHGDSGYLELKNAIDDLEPDQQVTLVALMWVGRGDYSIEEWDGALAFAGEAAGVTTAEYLIATPLLADYLKEGLSLHGYDID